MVKEHLHRHKEHDIDLAQVAYEAYAAHQDWKNYQGKPIPPWNDVRSDIQEAWIAAIDAVLEEGGIA